jgi:O-antigen ligase
MTVAKRLSTGRTSTGAPSPNDLGPLSASRRAAGLPQVGAGTVLVVCAVAVLLNHSSRVGGVNLSLADPIMVLALGALGLAGALVIPPVIVGFACALIAITLVTANTVAPLAFGVLPDGQALLSGLIKLLVSFAYLVCGIGIARAGIHVRALRWFAFGTLAVAALGLMMEATGIRVLTDVMFYGGVRFRGFMADPNYWSVLVAAAIAFLSRDPGMKRLPRVISIVILIASVLQSGSKTGVIVLVAYLAFLLLEKAFHSRHRVVMVTAVVLATGMVILLSGPLTQALVETVERYAPVVPQLSRVGMLITDPIGAISEGGSARESTWSGGVKIIEASPIVGIGIGTYESVNEMISGSRAVAHNTYLQLGAEWGILMSSVFLIWVVALLIRASRGSGVGALSVESRTVRDMIFVFLLASMSLSLNNARMFWLFLGVLVVLVEARTRNTRTLDSAGNPRVIPTRYGGA